MNKTLIIVTHPNITESTVNKRWIAELQKYPQRFVVHELYKHYPNGDINIEFEQRLVEECSHLVLQFPVYWFNCPPLLKQWLDQVFTYGWAYGSKSRALRNKKIGIAVSAGISAEGYSSTGCVGFEMTEVLRPFELTMRYVNANYQPLFVFYGIDSHAGYDENAFRRVENSAKDYIRYLDAYFN